MSGTAPAAAAPGSSSSAPASVGMEGGRRKGVTVKTLKRALKKNGLKTSGKKATLRARAKKARIMGGGEDDSEMKEKVEEMPAAAIGGRGRGRSKKSKGFRLY